MAAFSIILLGIVVFIYCIALFGQQIKKNNKYFSKLVGAFVNRAPCSPAPPGLPFIGNLHQVFGSKPFLTFAEWTKQLGDVYFLQLGSQRAVVLNSIESAREALVTNGRAFSGRPNFYTMSILHGGERKFVFSAHSDAMLKSYRKTVLADMRKRMLTLKPIVECEVDKMIDELFANGEDRILMDMRNIIHKMAANMAHGYAFGTTYSLDDPKLALWMKALAEYRELLHWFRPENFLPHSHIFLRNYGKQVEQFRKSSLELYKANIKIAKSNRKTCPDSTDNGLLDTLLDMNHGGEQVVDDDDDIISVLRDVMFGGSDGTFQPLIWLLMYVTRHPWVQDRIQEEIFSVIGAQRMPDLEDREAMPFVEATIREVLRHSEITSLGIPRRTESEVVIQGNSIPKDTMVIVNVYSIHRDSRHWKDPMEFNPGRFLNNEGCLYSTSELSYLPFSTGHRSCVGQNIARGFLFLLFARFFQKFQVLCVPDDDIPDMINAGGAFNPDLKPFNVQVERKQWDMAN